MVDRPLVLAGLEGGNVRSGSVIGDDVDHHLGIVSTIGDGIVRRLQTLEQEPARRLGRKLGQGSAEGAPASRGHQPRHGAWYSVLHENGRWRDPGPPFFPPAACWCARMIEESIR